MSFFIRLFFLFFHFYLCLSHNLNIIGNIRVILPILFLIHILADLYNLYLSFRVFQDIVGQYGFRTFRLKQT